MHIDKKRGVVYPESFASLNSTRACLSRDLQCELLPTLISMHMHWESGIERLNQSAGQTMCLALSSLAS